MSVQLSWYLEKRVIQLVNSGQISDQDMLDHDQAIIDHMNQSLAPLVHIIIDNSLATYTPSIKTITQARFPKHPQCGWVLLVGPTNTFTRLTNAVLTNVFRTRNRTFPTLDEALDFLNQMDTRLPPLRDITRKSPLNLKREI